MAKIAFLLTEGPWQTENWEVFEKLANAALDKGHEVEAFWYLDGIYNAIKHQEFPDTPEPPVAKMKKLVEKGANIIACGLCVNARGLQGGKEYIEGVTVGGLPDFAEMVGEADTVITL